MCCRRKEKSTSHASWKGRTRFEKSPWRRGPSIYVAACHACCWDPEKKCSSVSWINFNTPSRIGFDGNQFGLLYTFYSYYPLFIFVVLYSLIHTVSRALMKWVLYFIKLRWRNFDKKCFMHWCHCWRSSWSSFSIFLVQNQTGPFFLPAQLIAQAETPSESVGQPAEDHPGPLEEKCQALIRSWKGSAESAVLITMITRHDTAGPEPFYVLSRREGEGRRER